jgi:two-component system, OmpR family, response regulator
LRVLVVDDSPDSAESLALLLQFDGHVVQTAANGEHALATASSFSPEAVLLDIGLPGMDGYEVARRLRQLANCPDALLIALTGYGHEKDRATALAAGFDAHLVKPADPVAINSLLARHNAK